MTKVNKGSWLTAMAIALSLGAVPAAQATIIHFDFETAGPHLDINGSGIQVNVASNPAGLSRTAGGYGVRVDGPDNSILDNGEMLIFSVGSLPSGISALQLVQIEFAAFTDSDTHPGLDDRIIDVGLNADSFLRLALQNLRDFGETSGPLGPVNDWLVPGGYSLAPGMDLKITGLSSDCFLVLNPSGPGRIYDPLLNPNCDGYRVKELWFTASVPEPGTLALLGAALVVLAFVGRRRGRRLS